MKIKFAQMFTIRCKIKDSNTAEIVVMNSDTNGISLLRWNFTGSSLKRLKCDKHDLNLSAQFTLDGNVLVTITDLDTGKSGYVIWNHTLNQKLDEEKIHYDSESASISEESN